MNKSSSVTHSVLQKSSTLNRRYVKRPTNLQQTAHSTTDAEISTLINVGAKSAAEQRRKILVEEMKQEQQELVKKHRMEINVEAIDNDSGLENAIEAKKAPLLIPVKEVEDLPAEPNPYQAALDRRRAARTVQVAPAISAIELKNQAIAQALDSVAKTSPQQPISKKQAKQARKIQKAKQSIAEEESVLAKSFKKQKRRHNGAKFALAFVTSAACIAALGYFVHLNMPDISVRVAAMQAGIEATYPNYIPRGYQLSSVATDQDNRIIMEFNGPENVKFKLTEEKTSWDSNALLNNFVKSNWGINYTVMREQGITLYISNEADASWINGGLLYTLDSDGQLTKKQIKNIATSL
ncbi:DUF4367 domain-containing protein [Candidatus Saccharibacteria bacterium]|nr:DUF4367 domain-containing protein [Candidatus Saccharibacteria bacterium]